MTLSIKKTLFYLCAVLIIFGGQFLPNNGRLTGKLPLIKQQTLGGSNAANYISKGPAIIYFWAEWCGICKMMQQPMTEVLKDYPGFTVAVKSGNTTSVEKYLKDNSLEWKVVNDPFGKMSEQFKIKGVPSVFFLNEKGRIILTTEGYTSQIGLRLRMWLVGII